MKKSIQYRAGTAAEFTAENPVLAKNEIGIEVDTGKQKMGDGKKRWNTLAYMPTPGGGGGGGGGYYAHYQGTAAKDWTINHNLGYHPNITIVDSTKHVVIASIEHIDTNTATVHCALLMSGYAYCS